MSISPSYPVTLQNGTTADANQVMANFYAIQTDVNTNAAHNGANSDITSLEGLTTPLPISEGGTGASTAAQALINLGAASAASVAAIVTVPLGATIVWNAASSIPTGFLEENGQAISRTTYSALFAIIGVVFGAGDGSTTFNIPDSRGYFNRGWSHGSSVDSGRAFGSTQAGAIQAHTHSVTDPGHTHGIPAQLNGDFAGPANDATQGGLTPYQSLSATTGIVIGSTGGSETRPINIARMNIIRAI